MKRRLHKEPDTNTNEKKIKKVTEEYLRRDFKADSTNDTDRPVDANFKFTTRRFLAEIPLILIRPIFSGLFPAILGKGLGENWEKMINFIKIGRN